MIGFLDMIRNISLVNIMAYDAFAFGGAVSSSKMVVKMASVNRVEISSCFTGKES